MDIWLTTFVFMGLLIILSYGCLIITGMEVEAIIISPYESINGFYCAKFEYRGREYTVRIINYNSFLKENDIVKIKTRIIGNFPLGAYIIG